MQVLEAAQQLPPRHSGSLTKHAPVRSFRALISRISDEGCDSRTFRLEPPAGTEFSFMPGQFVLVSFPGEPELRRAYSLGSSPLERGALEITAARAPGIFTERLFRLSGGETLDVTGPQGRWVYRDEMRRAVLICEGVGVVPLRAMIRYALDKGLPNKLWLFYAERSPGCVLFKRDLEEFAGRGVEIHLTMVSPRESWGEDAYWDGPTGPWTAAAIRRRVPDFADCEFLLCGPNRLVDALREELHGAGIAHERVRGEKWGDY